jgi:DnaJ-class molecular chaperone
MYNETNLYNILELDNNASLQDIKQNFKKLALKYHPDKYKNKDANDKFNKIRIAYEILSNTDKKNKYDKMIEPKKKHFINKIFLFLQEITDPLTINNLVNKIDLTEDIKRGNITIVANKIIQKLLDEVENDSNIIQLSEIFIQTNNNELINNSTTNGSNLELSYSTSNYNTLNIIGNIKIDLYDIYNNNLKEIIVNRKVINNKNKNDMSSSSQKINSLIYNETNKYIIPLYDNKVIISKAGDKIINDNNTEIGDVILKLSYKRDKTNKIIKKKNDLIYNDNITLYSLFNGFNIYINIYDNIENINSINPFLDYNFDGTKLTIIINNKGFPYNKENDRGNLIIYLTLIKDNKFIELCSN